MKKQFIDNDKNANLSNGVVFYAVGLVLECYTIDGKGSPSGKDYCVAYIDPRGQYNCAWRAVGEITISDIEDSDAAMLERAFLATQS